MQNVYRFPTGNTMISFMKKTDAPAKPISFVHRFRKSTALEQSAHIGYIHCSNVNGWVFGKSSFFDYRKRMIF